MHQVIGACALDCPDGCSWVVTVDGDRAVSLRGNPDHPFTRGGLCAKVAPYLEYAASPDRLLHPLRRVGARGEGRFERISWDDALDEIAGRLAETVERHGGEAIWPFAGTGSLGYLQGGNGAGTRLFHALGASRHTVDICSRAGHAGLAYTSGSALGLEPEQLADSGLIMLWGTNTLTTNLHLWPFVTAGRDRGAPLVVVDPVRTRTAARADLHVAPRPGTDAALALGLVAELVRIGAADEEYLRDRTLGWPRFRDEALPAWSAARAAEVCGLDPAEITGLARLIADHRPLGIRALPGLQRHRGGGQALRALSCLPAVTGDYGRPGGGLCYSTGPGYPLDVAARGRPDLQPDGPTRQLAASTLGRELLERADPPVRALVLWAANPVVSNPDVTRTRAGLSSPDLFTVVIDHVLTDTARYADVVLPGTTQLEHADLNASYSHLYLNWNEPAVPPPGECLPHTEIFRRLAARMGLTDPALFASDHELARALLDGGHPAMAGITLERLRREGWARVGWPRPYLPFADGFPTASGRFEFSSDAGAADGAGRFPDHLPPYDVGREVEPGPDATLELISAAHHHLLNSTFGGSPRHTRHEGPTVLVHPEDAAERGLSDGVAVRVVNEVGEFTAVVRISGTMRPGVVSSAKGLWPGPAGGSSVNAVVAERPTDLGAASTFHDTRVRLVPLP